MLRCAGLMLLGTHSDDCRKKILLQMMEDIMRKHSLFWYILVFSPLFDFIGNDFLHILLLALTFFSRVRGARLWKYVLFWVANFFKWVVLSLSSPSFYITLNIFMVTRKLSLFSCSINFTITERTFMGATISEIFRYRRILKKWFIS